MDRRTFLAGAVAAGFQARPALSQSGRPSTGYLRTNWSLDPLTLGSYSFIAKGARKRHTSDLAEPVNQRLFFAGEATHPDYNSTVHAAIESGQFAAEAIAKTDARTVAIIGAGMAGLSAGQALHRDGRIVTVIEARDRIGGRIWTDTSLGAPLDLGASWIHGDVDNPLMDLARQIGAQTRPTSDSYVIRGADGRALRDSEAPAWLDEVVTTQHSAGAALADINTRAYWIDLDYDGDDMLLPRGYAPFVNALARDLDIRLDQQVAKITQTTSGVAIDGAPFDAVVVTVPLGALKAGAIRFDPPLPAQKQTAIDRLQMGVLDKLYLRYPAVFWDADKTWIITAETGLPPGQFNQWLNLHPYLGEPILVAFNGADPARDLSSLSDADIVARAETVLAQAYPG